MIKKIIVMSVLLWALCHTDLFSQSRIELRNIFYDAESWILYEDYKEALPLYLALLRVNPRNSNIKYRVGQCYINTPGEKEKAMPFLEDAVKNINPDYKKGKFNENGAPPEALFYLANAYLINNRLDKAIETFSLFSNNLDPKIYDTAVVRLQIQSCLNAKGLINKPLYIKESNLGNQINRESSELNPVISDDESILVFTRSYPFYDALLYSTKTEDGGWSVPINMNELLKVDNYFYPTSLSHDGKELYLYSSVDYDGIIYSTRFENGTWTPIEKLNDNINTKFWESHATISHDNKKLYFTSNRKGTYGGLDIYVSNRDSTGRWGTAHNLGPVINTPYNEESPFLSQDDRTLYFSSRGHFGMGGYDFFYSTLLADDVWSVPMNAGYPMNTTDDDVFYKPLNDGYEGYVAKYNPEGYGKQDLYKIEIFTDEHPRKFLVKGTVKVSFKSQRKNDNIQITARNKDNPEQLVSVSADSRSGGFALNLPHGNYEIAYKAQGAESLNRSLILPISYPSDTLILPGTVLSKGDLIADLSILGSKNRVITRGNPVIFKLRVEPNSLLVVRKYNGKKLISNQQFSVKDSIFTYRMVPAKGTNRISFKLTDMFDNTANENAYVTWNEINKAYKITTTSLPDIKMPVPPIRLASLTGTENVPYINNLVALRIAVPVRVGPNFSFAGISQTWILGAVGAGIILLFMFYRQRSKKENKTS